MHSLREQAEHTDAGNVEREIRCTGTFGYMYRYIQIVHALHRRGNEVEGKIYGYAN